MLADDDQTVFVAGGGLVVADGDDGWMDGWMDWLIG